MSLDLGSGDVGEENNGLQVEGIKDGIKQKIEPLVVSRLQDGKIMELNREFSFEGKNPFEYDVSGEKINWIKEEVKVTDDLGKVIFVQKDVKRPSFWSPLAAKVVASKYFWGNQDKGEREQSMEQLVGRIARFYKRQAVKQGYFNEKQAEILHDEIAAICLNQLCVFNSPVWFNAGITEYSDEAGGTAPFKWDLQQGKVIKTERGDDRPQCSACFIQGMEDNMESILDVQVSEANLFRAGSGTGSNRSALRSSKERLTGGGWASGPVSFMKGYDAYAGIIKSGGKTRRAAKMEILNIDHPDVIEFIESKQKEEKKAWALIEQGYAGGLNGDAYGSIFFQNCNMSVRITDEFMKAAKENKDWSTRFVKTGEVCETFKAKELLRKISEGTWLCGDPGLQNDSLYNKYHTCKASGRINATNPCLTGDTKVLTKNGSWKRIDSMLKEEQEILTNMGSIKEARVKPAFSTGVKPIYKLKTKCGYEIKLTGNHEVFTVNRGFVPAIELTKDDFVLLPNKEVAEITELDENNKTFYQILGVYLGDGCGSRGKIQLTMDKSREKPILDKFATYVSGNYENITHKGNQLSMLETATSGKLNISNSLFLNQFNQLTDLSLLGHQKIISDQIFALPLAEQKYILQGLFTADGTVANYGEKSKYVSLDSTSLDLLKGVQILLLGFGIKSKIYGNRRAGKLKSFLPDGKGGLKEYDVKEMHSLRISRSSRVKFEKLIGFMPESYKTELLKKLNLETSTYEDKPVDSINSLEYLGEEEVFDLTEPETHSLVANGITVHNCSEYAFLDDTACNLASINLMKFRTKEGGFDFDKFKKVVRTFIVAMELNIDGASYPTEKITERSHIYRTLGLGYANLGALLMSFGLPYDSAEGRAVAAAITAIMCGEAYKASAEIAGMVGPFPGYEENREHMLEVVKMHRDHVKEIDVEKMPENLRELTNVAWDSWSEALDLGEKYGFRNAQATVLAPTGTIAFMMDCDTTGIEPDIALVKYKVLSGGGMLKIVNKSVKLALEQLGYDEGKIKEIVEYIDKNDTIEGAPHVSEEHIKIFDCAFRPAKGTRSIHWKGHVDMMSVTQPFISGSISKTINMPESSTIEDIAEAYIYAWEKGLKAVAIYRENSKKSQPLNVKKTKGEMWDSGKAKIGGERQKLPQTRKSITHKFEIGGHEGYLSIGLYDDGRPGEIFVSMHKTGSTIRGLMDSWATSVSLNLQYGIPVDTLFQKFRHQKFEPSGFVKNTGGGDIDEKIRKINTASSIVDYVSQFMISTFGKGAGKPTFQVKVGEDEEQAELDDFGKKKSKVDDSIGEVSLEVEDKESDDLKSKICSICGAVGSLKATGNCSARCTSCNSSIRAGCGE